mgnify:CR=1 FL=1
MIYVTGDCHADFTRFNTKIFPEQYEMTKDDYVIICGDFGGVWNRFEENKHEKHWMDWLEDRPFTTLFCEGNHENFDLLNTLPEKEWNGGRGFQRGETAVSPLCVVSRGCGGKSKSPGPQMISICVLTLTRTSLTAEYYSAQVHLNGMERYRQVCRMHRIICAWPHSSSAIFSSIQRCVPAFSASASYASCAACSSE